MFWHEMRQLGDNYCKLCSGWGHASGNCGNIRFFKSVASQNNLSKHILAHCKNFTFVADATHIQAGAPQKDHPNAGIFGKAQNLKRPRN